MKSGYKTSPNSRFVGLHASQKTFSVEVQPVPEGLSAALAESLEEDPRRLHSYTITENEWILAAEIPLQRQHDNNCPQEQ